MGLILDTSIFIEAEREMFDLDGLLESAGDAPVAIAAVTASELLHGVARATSPAVRTRRDAYVEGILRDFPILPFGLVEAREHARIWAALAGRGTMIGPHDLLVAATALVVGSAIATLNQKEFKRVPGLSLAPISPFARSKRR